MGAASFSVGNRRTGFPDKIKNSHCDGMAVFVIIM